MNKISLKATNNPGKQSQLLFISYYFPPLHVNATVRIKNFYEGFMENGFQVFVITGKFPTQSPRDMTLQILVSNIIFIPLIGIRILFLDPFLNHHTLPLNWKRKSIITHLLTVRNRIPFNIILGDGGLFYALRAYLKGLKWIKQHKITHIFTTYSPMADHFVAFLLKCSYPHLHWIADFRDLPLDIKIPSRWNRSIFQIFFKKMLTKANEIITVSEGLATELRCFHSNLNIYSGCISDVRMHFQENRTETFNLNYTGSIYPDSQELYPLIKVIMELIEEGKMDRMDLKWKYCGIHSVTYKEWLAPYFREEQMEINPLFSLNDSKRRQREAGINLLLTWSTDIQQGILTTKLFEYLEAGRPILVWTNGKLEQEMGEILAHCQEGGYFQIGKEKEMKAWILVQYIQWKMPDHDTFNLQKLQEKYGKKSRNELIKKVSDKTPTRKNT